MAARKAVIRSHIERIDGVTRTWFEWADDGDDLGKTLVVEVEFDTDPNSTDYRQNVVDAIWDTAKGVVEDTTMVVSHIRIVPKR